MTRTLFVLICSAALLLAQGAGWKIALAPKGDLKASAPVPVEVTIKDGKGAPLAGAQVELVVTMVDMDHGTTRFPARESKSGIYQASPKFMMEGKWNIEVRAKKGTDSATMKQQVDVGE